jgi:hypothetical protein
MKKRLHKNKTKPADTLFESLVSNGFNFLNKSVQELEKFPKYSVIHFYMALELFFKARLLREHWALVVSKVEKASLQAFQNGDFISVTLDECLDRLKNIANESIQTHEYDCFRTIRDHRNKLVHFFHPDYEPPIDNKILAQIVSEQCKAWFYLHRLLTVKWKIHFVPYLRQIAKLEKLIRCNQHFLLSKFKALTPEIDAAKKTGISFELCCVCGCEAARVDKHRDPLFERNCLVCGWSSPFLKIFCPQCEKPIIVESEDGGRCEDCDIAIDLDYLINELGPYQHPKEENSIARCSQCENFEPSVIPFGDYEYLCLYCLTLHDEVGTCGYCGELITGDTDGTSIFGCFWCPGPDYKD